MTRIAQAVALACTMVIGGGMGAAITYNMTAKVSVTCPVASDQRPQAQTDFFKETQHFPTTGGNRY